MGREIKRVALDFDWPMNEVWEGFLMPDHFDEVPCDPCDSSGFSPEAKKIKDQWYGFNGEFHPSMTGYEPLSPSHPAIWAKAERNVSDASWYYGTGSDAVQREAQRLADHYNSGWCHFLNQEDVDALIAERRLVDFTHTWSKENGWQEKVPAAVVTAEQVNEWSLHGFGHDSINCHVVVKAKTERLGVPYVCSYCEGHGCTEAYPGQREEAEKWESTEPPAGEGWQVWETVSEGSPITPVFDSPENLARFLSSEFYTRDDFTYEGALNFINAGWAPSMVISNGEVKTGAEFAAEEDISEL